LRNPPAPTGTGALSVERIDGDDAVLQDGMRLPLRALADSIARSSRAIIQRRIAAHPQLADAVGTAALPTIRAVVLRRAEDSRVHCAVLRIPLGSNIVDNFDGGANGQPRRVDRPGDGPVELGLWGMGIGQVRQPTNPDTGAQLEGLVLPDWNRALQMTLNASRVLRE
jgi:hypothetical protein